MIEATPHVGGLPISIATSLAIENFLGIDPLKLNKNPPSKTTHRLMINVRTLVRNIYSSMDGKPTTIDPEQVLMYLESDIAAIKHTLEEKSSVKLSFYISSYKQLSKELPKASLRIPRTESQLWHAATEENLLMEFVKRCPPEWREDKSFLEILPTSVLTKHAESVMLLSHCPVDLLNRYRFNDLRLLESHTGKVKTNTQWNSKFAGSLNLERIPFNKAMLQVFGDAIHLRPMSITIKRAIIAIAIADRWTATTTKAKIMSSLKKNGTPEISALVFSLF